ncbi:protein phosphatase 2C domain-containing protein [Fictibacillus sp. Mic-4]|uniref:protein phosphatase 2C domain-containing protein n=1 Tax=Fictibacillus sp. Mic-4 TaxID=3132826 RepID=UPI003CEC694E
MIQQYSYDKLDVAVFQTSKKGNEHCGDSFFIEETDRYFICALADGLGSGSMAKEASETAIQIIKENHFQDIYDLMDLSNRKLKNTRGAVLSIFKIDYERKTVYFSGVGNIRFFFTGKNDKIQYPMPTPGFLSGRPFPFRLQQFDLSNELSFIIYSDGFDIQSKNKYLLRDLDSPVKSIQSIGNFVQDFSDDATCLIGKMKFG